MKKIFTIILMLLLSLTAISQNTIIFKSGECLYGKITSVDEVNIIISPANKINTYYKFPLTEVKSYSYDIINPFEPKPVNVVPDHFKTAGKELELAADHFEIGSALAIGGAIAITLSLNNTSPSNMTLDEQKKSANTKKILGIGGGVLSIVGLLLQIESFSHIRNAGLLIGQNSVGVAVKF